MHHPPTHMPEKGADGGRVEGVACGEGQVLIRIGQMSVIFACFVACELHLFMKFGLKLVAADLFNESFHGSVWVISGVV